LSSIGYATLSVIPSAKGFGSALTSSAGPEMDRASKSLGARMSAGMFTVLKAGAVVAGAAIVGAVGAVLVKGWGRLTAIENATAKLTGLGNSATTVAEIMDNANASVLGTAYGLDEAATVAAGAVAAGIKPGEELRRILGLTADGATLAGTSMGAMGAIFNKVAASNKIQGDVIAQLQDAGIPIVELLGKVMGKTSEQVTALAAKGKIDFPTFAKAMEQGLGGAALASGNTTEGAFKNMGAAISRFGAKLLIGVFPIAKTVFGGITKWVDDLSKKAAPFAAAFSTALTTFITGFQTGEGAGGKFRDILTAIWEKGLKPVATFITGTAIPAVQSFVKGFQDGTGPGGAFKDFLIQLYDSAIKPISDFLTSTAVPAIQSFVQGFRDGTGPGGDLKDALQKLASFITDTALPALKSIEQWITGTGSESLGSLKGWVNDNKTAFEVLSVFITAALIPALGLLGLNALITGYKMAAAWLIGLGPVGWIIAAVVAIGAAFLWLYDNVDWFRAGVDWMWKGIQNSFTSSWNYVIQPVLVFLVQGLANVMNSFGSMLVVLGQVPGFGWATDAGNKILGAASAVRGFSADIKKIPDTVDVAINVTANYSAAVATVLGGARAAVKLAGFAEGGTVLPTPGGTIVRVAEAGRKETIVDTATLNAAMAQKQKPAVNASAPFDYDRLATAMARVQIGLDGRGVSTSVDQRIGGLLR